MGSVIRLEKFTKFYGKVVGIEGVDLEVESGEVFGYLGPNGAGKSTTIRLLLDLIRPTSGRAEVLGLNPQTDSLELRRKIGYLPGELELYPRLTGYETVKHFAAIRGDKKAVGRASGLASRLDLDLGREIEQLSRGNKQKVGLVLAFMHDPKLLILDEPTSGLDPLVQQEFYRLLREVKDEGGTIFLSSHVLSEVERIADRVGILRGGEMVEVATLDALKQRAHRSIEIDFAEHVDEAVFAGIEGVSDLLVNTTSLRCTIRGDLDPLIKAAARYHVVSVSTREADLENLFLEYYRGGPDAS